MHSFSYNLNVEAVVGNDNLDFEMNQPLQDAFFIGVASLLKLKNVFSHKLTNLLNLFVKCFAKWLEIL